MALRTRPTTPGVARRMSERARAADRHAGSGSGDAPSIDIAGGFAGMVDALRGLVCQLADAARATGEAAPAGGSAPGDENASRADGATQFSIGESKTRVVFGYSLRGSPAGVSAEPFGHVPHRPAADQRGPRRSAAAVRQPIVDVFEDAGTVVVVAELPGADPASITCEPQGSTLLIEASGGQTYSKAIALPARVDAGGMVRSFRHGILEVRLKKAAAP